MSSNPEEDIEKKLKELEVSLKETDPSLMKEKAKDTGLVGSKASNPELEKELLSADLQQLAGYTLLGLGLLILFNHLRIGGSSFAGLFGFGTTGGAGFLMLLLVIGIGFLFYDYKNKVGWVICAASLAAILFVVLSQMFLYFPQISVLGFIFMFIPFAFGAALLAKGYKKRRQIGLTSAKNE